MAYSNELSIIINAKDNASKEFEKLSGTLKENSKTFRDVGIAMTAIGGAITFALGKSVKAAQEQERAEARLTQLIRQTTQATDEQINSLKEQATALQKTGVVADEVIVSGQSQLATFSLNTEQIKKLTPALLDMVVAQNGVNATQENAQDIANAVGRAIDNGVGALTRYGISLTETQKQLYETASREEKVSLLTEILNSNYGGLNEATRKTSEGGIAGLKNSFGELQEMIGLKIIPILNELVKKISPVIEKIANWIEKNPELTQKIVLVVAAIGGLMVVLGPLLIALPGIVTAVGLVGAAFGLLLSPIGLVVAAIAGITVAAIYFIKHWQDVKDKLKSIWESIKNIFISAIDSIMSKIQPLINAIISIKNTASNIGGNILQSFANLPANLGFDNGGIVPGAIGQPQLATVHGGETILPTHKTGASSLGNTFNFDFKNASITDKDQFIKDIINNINRVDQLTTAGAL